MTLKGVVHQVAEPFEPGRLLRCLAPEGLTPRLPLVGDFCASLGRVWTPTSVGVTLMFGHRASLAPTVIPAQAGIQIGCRIPLRWPFATPTRGMCAVKHVKRDNRNLL